MFKRTARPIVLPTWSTLGTVRSQVCHGYRLVRTLTSTVSKEGCNSVQVDFSWIILFIPRLISWQFPNFLLSRTLVPSEIGLLTLVLFWFQSRGPSQTHGNSCLTGLFSILFQCFRRKHCPHSSYPTGKSLPSLGHCTRTHLPAL